jgi:hypothetical protein
VRGGELAPVASRPRTPPTLEGELLRQALYSFSAGACRCADCGRTPLIGERVHVYEDGRVMCELCRPHRREEPIRCERVRGEHGHAVRVTVRAA